MDGATKDSTHARNDAVGWGLSLVHTELGGAVLGKHPGFAEGVVVDKQLDAFAGGELAALVLLIQLRLATTEGNLGACFLELLEAFLHRRFVNRHVLSFRLARP